MADWPSPNSQLYPAIVPSGSVEPLPVRVTARPSTVGSAMTAVGAWFAGGGVASSLVTVYRSKVVVAGPVAELDG
nr:hypothetical protein [Tessaracoccus coleopterorum]